MQYCYILEFTRLCEILAIRLFILDSCKGYKLSQYFQGLDVKKTQQKNPNTAYCFHCIRKTGGTNLCCSWIIHPEGCHEVLLWSRNSTFTVFVSTIKLVNLSWKEILLGQDFVVIYRTWNCKYSVTMQRKSLYIGTHVSL